MRHDQRAILRGSRAEYRATRGRDPSAVAAAGSESGAVPPSPYSFPLPLGDGSKAVNPRGLGGTESPGSIPIDHHTGCSLF